VVGLGPGDWSQLTLGALDALLAAEHIFLRTAVHPTVEPLRARLRADQRVETFDALYERAESFDALYARIVGAVLDAVAEGGGPVVYAVPGHPMIGERTVQLLLAEAPAHEVPVRVVDGLSFIEPVARALGLDPLATSTQIIDGITLLASDDQDLTAPWRFPSPRLLDTGRPQLIGQVYDRRVASACKIWLLERYPDDHPVSVVRAAGTSEEAVRTSALARLDFSTAFDHLSCLYVPPLDPLQDRRSLAAVPYIAARLRAPDGCPWDRKQTLASLKPHLLEEAYEAVAALDADDIDALVEELGDVLLLVVMLAQIGEEATSFDLPALIEGVAGKLIGRHPHVFGEQRLGTAEAVLKNWERLKEQERAPSTSALDGVPAVMPALIASQVMQRKAAALGFDWPDLAGVFAKVEEEMAELGEAPESHRLEEAGDLLFAVVSLCRHLGLDADEALRQANAKFRRRFQRMEALSAARGTSLSTHDAAALDRLWEAAKAEERRP
jgi:tetrapyrrole methylase family protein/MazG family protein